MSHDGMIVFLLKPTPNSRRLPSLLNKKDGLIECIIPYAAIKIAIEIVVI